MKDYNYICYMYVSTFVCTNLSLIISTAYFISMPHLTSLY